MSDRSGSTGKPLIPIAVFAGLVEVVGLIVLPSFDAHIQEVFVWFLMLFPVLVVLLSFATVLVNRRELERASGRKEDDSETLLAPPTSHGGRELDAHPDDPAHVEVLRRTAPEKLGIRERD
jgi:hypothetical protein